MKKKINTCKFMLVSLCIFICSIINPPYKVSGASFPDAGFIKINSGKIINAVNVSVINMNKINIGEKEIKSENEIIKIHLKIPVVSGIGDATIQNKINNTFLNDALIFKSSMEKQAAESYDSVKMGDLEYNAYGAYTTYTVKYNKNDILSITVMYYQYTGGAHGQSTQAGYNFDLKTGRLLQLSDLFQQGFNYKKIIDKIILNYMEAHKGMYFSEAINSFQGIDGMHPYYIQDGNLVVFFSEDEIAPHAAGIQEFRIPYSRLKFKTEFKKRI